MTTIETTVVVDERTCMATTAADPWSVDAKP